MQKNIRPAQDFLAALKTALLWLCILTVVLLCSGNSEVLAVQVTPLGDAPAAGSADLGVTSPLVGPDNSMSVPTPAWTTGTLLPMDLWERYSKRPPAFGQPSRPQTVVPGYIPHGVVDGHGRIVTPAQAGLLAPRSTVPDPAATPVLPLQEKRSSGKKSAPAGNAYATGSGQTAPRVSSPSVAAPTAPSVPGVTSPHTAAAPTAPVAPSTPAAAPYSTPAAPTGPITPSQPSVGIPAQPSANSPSIAAQTQGQGGVMDAGSVPTSTPPVNSNTANTNSPPAGSGATGTTSGTGNPASGTSGATTGSTGTGSATAAATGTSSATTGASGANGNEVMGTLNTARPPVLGGPAESLVIPPPGISLTPNDVPAALTAPPRP